MFNLDNLLLVLLGALITFLGTFIKQRHEKNKNIFNHYNIFDEKRNKAFEDISEYLNKMTFFHPGDDEFNSAYYNILTAGKQQFLFDESFNQVFEELSIYMKTDNHDENKFIIIKNKMIKEMHDKTGIDYIDKYIDKYTKIKKVKSK